ncbi:hypothetical protein K9K77_02815 [Candidatus Babeliales bacterium]|nr:hypothetical protein [Candidatus Babeliales bacterium]
MKKLSLILLLSLGSQSSLFSAQAQSWGNWIKASSSSLKDEISTRISGGTSYVKDTAHAVAAKAVSAKDTIVTTTLNGTSFIKDKTTSFANNSSAFIKDNQKASIACGVALVTGAAYLAYRNYKAKKTAKQILQHQIALLQLSR